MKIAAIVAAVVVLLVVLVGSLAGGTAVLGFALLPAQDGGAGTPTAPPEDVVRAEPAPTPAPATEPVPAAPVEPVAVAPAPASPTPAPSGSVAPAPVAPAAPEPVAVVEAPTPPAPAPVEPEPAVAVAEPEPAVAEPAPAPPDPMEMLGTGMWRGTASGRPLELRFVGAAEGIVRAEAVYVTGPTRRVEQLSGTFDAATKKLSLRTSDGKVTYQGRLAGGTLSGTYMQQGGKALEWTATR